ncbi:16S rRNA (uracil(1498)-N(3))-methyltransferase [Nocardioides islandensis]|jgi:16S rRNA (uracil1498-N3)-methyltransferase|uniref:Ribosomal RNA small subunit methyltransferase E n=1 Tax=Nocardioides islandensis TaxID=433663 RepID=A0A930VBJ5_9ACTN|nr:16S rRNA (uracil(1498)-N(3))-methyltransferase [Nocardioides islandensis]MBF4761556.1 16S rRNA (uracil(1498)-N(3))-methyltransferase [Nocardioides islandensis]
MSLPVHWVESLADAVEGGTVEVTGDEAHHAVAVRRLRVGESVVLTDGRGRSVTGPVASTGKRVFAVTAASVSDVPEPVPTVTVVQAIPKGDRGELAVEVLTEIGVARIVPWAASRSVAVWKGERGTKALARWRSTAREASKQARRAWFAEVTEPAGTADVVGLVEAADRAVVLHEEATSPLSGVEPSGSLLVVVGPEGGLSDEEVAAFEAAGAHAVRLGPEVLRTSTAGVAAVAALLARTGRWGYR